MCPPLVRGGAEGGGVWQKKLSLFWLHLNMAKKFNNLKYLKSYRKELRNNPTKAETMLWKALRKRQLDGKKFRRQHSLGNFIVDFYCPEEKLAIELDGETHANIVNNNYDDQRTEKLETFGVKVVRFENKNVFENLDMVLEAIRTEFRD